MAEASLHQMDRDLDGLYEWLEACERGTTDELPQAVGHGVLC